MTMQGGQNAAYKGAKSLHSRNLPKQYRKKLLKREKERKSAVTASGTGSARNSRAGGVNEVAGNYVYKNIFRNFTGG